ncbi:MAG: O-antigen ligase family protein, partial [Gemmatimonadales bacterium]
MISFAYVALWIFIFALPWENMIVITGVGTISRLMGMFALGGAVLAAMVTGRLRRWRLFHVSALLFVIWSGWNIYRGEIYRLADHERTMSKFETYVQLFLVLWMIWELAPSIQRLRGLMLGYVLGAYVAALATVVVSRTAAATMRRFSAEGFDPNDLAMILALGMPMAWYLGMTYRHLLLRWICRAYLPLGLVAIGLTGSRGGIVVGVVALMVVPMTMTRLSPGKIAAAAIALFGSGAIAVANIPETTLQRLGTTGSEMEAGTFNGRMLIWKAGLEALTKKPAFGYGTGGFGRAIRPVLGYSRDAHNSYLAVLVEQGMLGFLLFSAMFLVVFLQVLNLPLLERRFALILLATLAIAMLPLTWDDQKQVWFILALLVAFSEAMLHGKVALPTMQPVRRWVRRPYREPVAPGARGHL